MFENFLHKLNTSYLKFEFKSKGTEYDLPKQRHNAIGASLLLQYVAVVPLKQQIIRIWEKLGTIQSQQIHF